MLLHAASQWYMLVLSGNRQTPMMITVFECHCCAAPAVRPGRGTVYAVGKSLQKLPNDGCLKDAASSRYMTPECIRDCHKQQY